jgi:NO-binding membrane sensor protein with MHYT domain
MVQLRVVYDPKIVALAAAIGFAGAFGAVSTCEQFRLATVNKRTTIFSYHWVLLVGGSFGGVCVWGAHFVGISSFRLMHGEIELPLRYDLGNALMLLAISLFLTTAAVAISIADDCFNRSTREIMEKFIAQATNSYTINQLKQMGRVKILSVVFSHSIEKPVIGGLISAGAVGVMHYVGMKGMRFQGTIEYDPGVVFASCLTSVCVIIGGFWLFFRVLSLFPSLDILRVLSACNGMFGITALHYIGLQAATFNYDPDASLPDPGRTVGRQQMLVGVLIACAIYTVLILVYVICDLRVWLRHTSMQLHHADLTLATVQKLSDGRSGVHQLILCETGRYAKRHRDNTAVPVLAGYGGDIFPVMQYAAPRALYNDTPENEESGWDYTSSDVYGPTQSVEMGTTPTSGGATLRSFGRPHSRSQVHPLGEGVDDAGCEGVDKGTTAQGDIESQLLAPSGARHKPSSDSTVGADCDASALCRTQGGRSVDTSPSSPRGPASLTSGPNPLTSGLPSLPGSLKTALE